MGLTLGAYVRKRMVLFAANIIASKASKSIFYHDIHSGNSFTHMSTHVNLFKDHIRCIRDSGFEIVSSITEDEGQVEISFDDGYRGIYENIDLIDSLNFPIQLFVATSFINKDSYISEGMLKEMSKHPLIQINSHTISHKRLDLLNIQELEVEFMGSKQYLEDLTQKDVLNICFPEGRFSPSAVTIANKCGYKRQYSSIPGPFSATLFDGMVLRRSLVQFSDKDELRAVLKGGDNILSSWYFNKHFSR